MVERRYSDENNYVTMLDRTNRNIRIYDRRSKEQIQSMGLSNSTHDILRKYTDVAIRNVVLGVSSIIIDSPFKFDNVGDLKFSKDGYFFFNAITTDGDEMLIKLRYNNVLQYDTTFVFTFFTKSQITEKYSQVYRMGYNRKTA